MNITILDAKKLSFDEIDGIKVTEISDIALKGSTLYAISDRGYLYTFNISIDNTIQSVTLKSATTLKRKNKKILRKYDRDSEGLAFLNNNLLISFERKPRVNLFSTDGIRIKNKKIYKDLRDVKKYHGSNKALEAVAYSKKYGVVTAPEVPLRKEKKSFHRLYTKDTIYKFKVSGNITALEFIDEATIMVLERSINKKHLRFIITISKVYLKGCKNKVCKSEVLATLDSFDGWHLDNFEGLTKVGKNRYLMISDDNDNLFQKTLLVLFEI